MVWAVLLYYAMLEALSFSVNVSVIAFICLVVTVYSCFASVLMLLF